MMIARETITFAAGCFWGVEAAFRKVPGVLETRVGYTGGHTEHPTYREVCAGGTGHAEAVEVVYDPNVVSFGELLEVFWGLHTPSPATKAQYRSVIFTHTQRQRQLAGKVRKKFTEVEPVGIFWPAEEYHQRYYEKNGLG